MTSLSEALKHGKLKRFIRERKGEEGNADALDRAVRSMAGNRHKPDEKPK